MAQVESQKLTAEALLSAPSPGSAVPNYNGKLALYSVSTHTFGDKTVGETRVMDLEKQTSGQIFSDEKVHDVLWIPGSSDVACLRSGDKGNTDLLVTHGDQLASGFRIIATFAAPVKAMKLHRLDSGGVVVVVAGLVKEGSLFNDQATQLLSTGRVFDTVKIRHWNEWYKKQRFTLWYNVLEYQSGEWKLAGELINLINGSALEAPDDVYGPRNASDCFDISEDGVAFVGKDLARNKPHEMTFAPVYFVAVHSFTQAPGGDTQIISLPPHVGDGNAWNIRFLPDNTGIAFMYADAAVTNGARLYAAPLVTLKAYDVVQRIGSTFDDDSFNPPSAFEFAGASDSIVFQSDRRGRGVLSFLKLQEGEAPRILVGSGSVSSFYALDDTNWDRLLVSSSSFVTRSICQVIKVSDGTVIETVSLVATDESALLGMSAEMVIDYEFKGADGYPVHSFIVRPSNFDEKMTYPWIVMVHGGPVASWSDRWTSTWNAAIWARRGYVVICPNITGSTGYGLQHARRIRNDWAGRPYEDLICLMANLENMAYLDQSKAIIAGGSYGAFLISWMMGHEIIKKFCGALWSSGTYNLSTFPLHTDSVLSDISFNDATYPWQDPAAFEKFNPAKPELIRNWGNAPPTLIVHSEMDYRCCITEGLAAFKTLQAHGVPSRFLTFSDECHYIQKPENLKVWHETVEDWLAKCVNGEVKRTNV